MPTLESLRAIDQAHRIAQARNAQAVARAVGLAWTRVDPQDVSGSFRPFLDTAMPLITGGRQRAVSLAGGYAERTRREQDPGLPRLVLPPPPPANLEQIRKSLIYLGPVTVGQEMAKRETVLPPLAEPDDLDLPIDTRKSPSSIMERAATLIVGAAIRHVQNGGRAMIDEVVAKDAKAVGYVRITQGSPCAFCAMLASRGPVYKEESFDRSDPRFDGPGNHKVHDHCGCTIRPLYSKSRFAMPEENQRFREIYETATSGYSYKEAMNAFRRVYERPEIERSAPVRAR